MTSKIQSDDEDEGIDLSITLIGTPFEPEEDESKLTRREREERAKEKYTPLWKQEFKDERGRKVLPHGAFKGGRVAGYNNTVGSAEGWTPSQFISSRSQRAQIKVASITDFMDAEDFEEMGFGGGKELTAHVDYQTFGPSSTQKKTLPTTALIPEDLIAPSKDPIGVRLLRLMGWREGKGIGPRKKRAPPKKTTEKKVYGAALPPGLAAIKENEADDVPEDEKPQIVITSSETQFDSVETNTIENQNEDDTYDPYAENFTFAPENVPVFEFKPKEDTYGLGYDPFVLAPEFREAKQKSELQKERQKFGNAPKEVMKMGVEAAPNASKFGLSVLEDADDIDIYGDQPELYNPVINDDFPTSESSSLKADIQSKSGLITGFVRAKHPPPKPKYFPPPEVPRDFNPRHTFTEPPPTLQQFFSRSGEIQIDPEKRGQLLGETPLPRVSSTPSVFDLLSEKDRKRLEELSGKPLRTTTTTTTTNDSKNQKSEETSTSVSMLNPPSRDPTPMSDLMAFRNNPEKQQRYEFWMKVQKGLVPTPVQWNDGLSESERQKEHEEFKRVWGRFRFLNEAMSKRFTSGNFLLGDHEYDEKSLNEYKVEGHQTTAAQYKMFGALTRTVEEWRPSNILCRRMNIYNPYRGVQSQSNKTKENEKKSLTRIMQMEMDPLLNPMLSSPTEFETMTNAKLQQLKDQNVKKPEAESDISGNSHNNETVNEDDDEEDKQFEEQKPPPIDLFKAIFETSDDQNETQPQSLSTASHKTTTKFEMQEIETNSESTNAINRSVQLENNNETEIGPQPPLLSESELEQQNPSPQQTAPNSSATKGLQQLSQTESCQTSEFSLFEEVPDESKEVQHRNKRTPPREIEERNVIHRQTTTMETQQETLNALKKLLLPSSSSKPTPIPQIKTTTSAPSTLEASKGLSSLETMTTPTNNRKRKKEDETDSSSSESSSISSDSERHHKGKKEKHKKKIKKHKHKQHKHKHKKKKNK